MSCQEAAMKPINYAPIFETTRGDIIESIHFGAFAIVDSTGKLTASQGDPNTITYLRSSAKPFQALPFVESGGVEHFDLSMEELALICASHSGTDKHIEIMTSFQQKTQLSESDLLCGIHPPFDKSTSEVMRIRNEEPTANRHNCSGKHTGMLAFAVLNNYPKTDYVNLDHPVQKRILKCFAEMCALDIENVKVGIDGCSAPNFAVPLYNAALAYARLCDPTTLSTKRANACHMITNAMTAHPAMIAGPNRFDTNLMETGKGRIVSKGGAEGYQAIGLMPGALHEKSPALGITIKISDGDLIGRVRPGVTLEILHLLGAIDDKEIIALEKYQPRAKLYNWRKLIVGNTQPSINL